MNYYLNNVAANDKCCAAEAYKNVSLYYYVKHFSFGGEVGVILMKTSYIKVCPLLQFLCICHIILHRRPSYEFTANYLNSYWHINIKYFLYMVNIRLLLS